MQTAAKKQAELKKALIATEDECYNITVKNVFTRAKQVLNIAGAMKNVVLENIKGFDGNEEFLVNNSSLSDEELIKNV